MYRWPLAGVFEFGFCANGENQKQNQRRRRDAGGTKGKSERQLRRPEASGTKGGSETPAVRNELRVAAADYCEGVWLRPGH